MACGQAICREAYELTLELRTKLEDGSLPLCPLPPACFLCFFLRPLPPRAFQLLLRRESLDALAFGLLPLALRLSQFMLHALSLTLHLLNLFSGLLFLPHDLCSLALCFRFQLTLHFVMLFLSLLTPALPILTFSLFSFLTLDSETLFVLPAFHLQLLKSSAFHLLFLSKSLLLCSPPCFLVAPAKQLFAVLPPSFSSQVSSYCTLNALSSTLLFLPHLFDGFQTKPLFLLSLPFLHFFKLSVQLYFPPQPLSLFFLLGASPSLSLLFFSSSSSLCFLLSAPFSSSLVLFLLLSAPSSTSLFLLILFSALLSTPLFLVQSSTLLVLVFFVSLLWSASLGLILLSALSSTSLCLFVFLSATPSPSLSLVFFISTSTPTSLFFSFGFFQRIILLALSLLAC
mmetsp:Transcript_71148/g.130229  ORF Transcript_71148/g.130229 Transcript_71148/m.130229 type:complete len:399 (-) Transcript_71148:515-1711(-)